MIVDGRKIAEDVLARAKARASTLARPPQVVAIVANTTPATESYLKIKRRFAEKAGCIFTVQRFPEDVDEATLRAAVEAAEADTVIVQLPLPTHLDARAVCDAIPVEKDADVLSTRARTRFESGSTEALLPPVVGAVREVVALGNVALAEGNAVVVGEGWLVGKPAATWLAQAGANVTVGTEKSENLLEALRAADIIVSGAGAPHFIKPEMIKEGAVLIDAGTSESGGQLAGDADPACAPKCATFTPVPGGVGPIAVACLFDNATTLAARKPFLF